MGPVHVRPAAPDDAEGLATLRYEFRAALATPNETEHSFVGRCGTWMCSRLAAEPPAWRAWVALADGVIAGNIWLQLIEKVPNPVPEPEAHGYVTNLFVRPRFRGLEIGERLVSAALAWCREHQVHAVILWPTARSRSLYARHGFAVPQDILALNVAPGSLDGLP